MYPSTSRNFKDKQLLADISKPENLTKNFKDKKLLVDISKSESLEDKLKVDIAKQHAERGNVITNKQFQSFRRNFYHIQRDISQLREEECIRCKIARIGIDLISSNSVMFGSIKPQAAQFMKHRLTSEQLKDLPANIFKTSISYALQDLIRENKISMNVPKGSKHFAIYAPPGSGKTTFQIELLKRGIFVQDFDLLYNKNIESLNVALQFSSVLVNDPSKISKDTPLLVFSMSEHEFITRVKAKTGKDKETLKIWFKETSFNHVRDKFFINMSNTYLSDWIKLPQRRDLINSEISEKLENIVEQTMSYNITNKSKRGRTSIPIQTCCSLTTMLTKHIICESICLDRQ